MKNGQNTVLRIENAKWRIKIRRAQEKSWNSGELLQGKRHFPPGSLQLTFSFLFRAASELHLNPYVSVHGKCNFILYVIQFERANKKTLCPGCLRGSCNSCWQSGTDKKNKKNKTGEIKRESTSTSIAVLRRVIRSSFCPIVHSIQDVSLAQPKAHVTVIHWYELPSKDLLHSLLALTVCKKDRKVLKDSTTQRLTLLT